MRATTCTKKACRDACCNACSWAATFATKGGPQQVERARVEALLQVTGGALDCELDAWNAGLAGQSVSLTPPGCVVR